MAEPEADAEVLEGCRRGDPEAQRALYERYKDRVFSIALHFLRGDEPAAKDVTQEVFVKVFRGVSSFRADARLSTWLYRVVANACTDELRRNRRLVFMGDIPPSIAPSVDPEGLTEVSGAIVAAVERLSPKLRLVVLLRYFEDLSYDKIADALGCSAGTVASRLHRAHTALAADLSDRQGATDA